MKSIDESLENMRANQEYFAELARDKRIEEKEQQRKVEKKYLESAIEKLEVQCALDHVGVHSVLDYMVFVADTIHSYMGWYATKQEEFLENGLKNGGAYDPNPPFANYGKMSEILPTMWGIVRDMATGILTRDSAEVLSSLAWANHVEHCGGSLLQDHGDLAFCAIDAISNNGLTSVFGDASVEEFTDFIEVGL